MRSNVLFQKHFIATISAMVLALLSPALGHAAEILSEGQMDSVTAGGAGGTLTLSANASGPTAITSTTGAIQTGQADILTVSGDPKTGLHLTGEGQADIVFGGGKAVALGNDANCTAQMTLVGNFTYTNQYASASTTPISAICQCSAIAIQLAH